MKAKGDLREFIVTGRKVLNLINYRSDILSPLFSDMGIFLFEKDFLENNSIIKALVLHFRVI